jgi:hypothetical protein
VFLSWRFGVSSSSKTGFFTLCEKDTSCFFYADSISTFISAGSEIPFVIRCWITAFFSSYWSEDVASAGR